MATSVHDMTMHFHRNARATLLASLGLLGSACDLGPKSIGGDPLAEETGDEADGGSSEGESGGGSETAGETGITDPAFGDCGLETETIITSLGDIPPGFDTKVMDVIEVTDGYYSSTLTWNENQGFVTIPYAGTMSPAEVNVEYLGGEIRLLEVELVGQEPAGLEDGGLCSNRLEIDARISVKTEDGRLDEVFMSPIVFESHNDELPFSQIPLDFASLQGTFSSEDISISNDGELLAAYFMLSYAGDTISGGVALEILVMDFVGFGGVASLEGVEEIPMP